MRPQRLPGPWIVAAVVIIALGVGAGVWLAQSSSTSDEEVVTFDGAATAWLAERDGTVTVGWPVLSAIAVVDDGRVVGGYGAEAWDLAAVRLGIEVEHVAVPGDLSRTVEALRDGTIDVAGGLGERDDVAAFAVPSVPWAWVPTVFVGSEAVAGTDVFQGRTATTIAGSPLVDLLATTHPEVEYVEIADPVAGLAAVVAGEVDLFFGPLAVVGPLMQRLDVELAPIGEAVSVEPVRSWTASSAAASVVDTVRASVTDDELRLLHVRWTGFDLTDPAQADGLPRWLLPLLAVVGVVLVGLAAATLALRTQVRRATAELAAVNEHLEETVDERTEQLQESAARLRRSNAALKRFSSTAAHDLKGPLTGISGFADVLLRMDLPREQVDELLARMRDSADRLGRMVDDMLDDALRMGAGAEQLPAPAFAAWLDEVTAPERDVVDCRLVVDVPDRLIDADVEVLRRAAINLVGNATKYAVNQDGTVVEVTLRRLDEVWELQVDDNGPGIPQGMWSEVFDLGRRLTHDDRGFGLGLSSIRDLVQGAGGAIRIGDADLGGAAFTVVLPVQPGTATGAADTIGAASSED